ncbi:MAG: aminotransferase class I/II-fold pyridoxal phosphate-dependent enzyme [Rhodomicrobium sp.]|jgi:aspartate/methionine/tyrosine aminotransferase
MQKGAAEAPAPASNREANAPSLRSAIGAFVVMDVMREANARQAAGQDIIHMEVGQPGTPAPRLVREAVAREIGQSALGYTDALGLPALRARIARHYRDAYDVDVSPERIVVTTGSSAGFVLAFLALLDPGDGLALPQPGYPCYRQIARVLGLEPVYLPARTASRFMPTAKDVTAAFRERGARAVLLASPSNPTGAMLEAGALGPLVQAAREAGGWFISDEIYHGLTYEAPAQTALAFSGDAIVINSFSKYYSMTGWRIGWMAVPARLTRIFERLAQNLYISPPTVSQAGALAAFDAVDELESYKAVYARNREMLLNELPRAGFDRLAPADGAFYLYADASALTDDSEAYLQRMLRETGVAATPGIDFDEDEGRRFIRFSYAGPFERMREAARRLRVWTAR